MPQSLVKNYVHIVCSTKYRQPFIYPPYESELHAYLAAVCADLGCTPIKVGGYTDHVHVLCMLSQKVLLMKLVETIKSHSSKWYNTKDESLSNFYWQDGYAAFSVSPGAVDKVIAYIENQHIHHQKTEYQTEFRKFMWQYKVEYDERYVMD